MAGPPAFRFEPSNISHRSRLCSRCSLRRLGSIAAAELLAHGIERVFPQDRRSTGADSRFHCAAGRFRG
jgi:hypothetical protein